MDDVHAYMLLNKLQSSEVLYFKDGTGQNAVELIQRVAGIDYNDVKPDRCYFLVYDKSNVRTSVREFSWKSHRMQ